MTDKMLGYITAAIFLRLRSLFAGDSSLETMCGMFGLSGRNKNNCLLQNKGKHPANQKDAKKAQENLVWKFLKIHQNFKKKTY